MNRVLFRSVVLLAFAAALAAGCGSSDGAGSSPASSAAKAKPSADPSKDKLAQVLARGTLVLFTDPKYPPQSFAVKGARWVIERGPSSL